MLDCLQEYLRNRDGDIGLECEMALRLSIPSTTIHVEFWICTIAMKASYHITFFQSSIDLRHYIQGVTLTSNAIVPFRSCFSLTARWKSRRDIWGAAWNRQRQWTNSGRGCLGKNRRRLLN